MSDKQQNEMSELNPQEMGDLLDLCFEMNRNVFMWGPPGVGKTDLTKQLAVRKGCEYLALHLTLLEPVDLRGMPVVNEERTAVNWVPMGELPRDPASRGIIHLDELNTADPSVMAAAMQFCLDRRIGTYVLPEQWRIVACGNRLSDGAAARRMPTALADRFSHVTLLPSVDSWTGWAMDNGVAPELVAFLNFRKDLLFPEFSSTRTVNTTPRGWADVSRVITLDPALERMETNAYAAGRVGVGPVSELRSFIRVWRDLPNIKHILEGKITDLPDGSNPSVKYAVTIALSMEVKLGQVGTMLEFLEKVGPEFSRMAVFAVIRRLPRVTSDPDYQNWVTHRMTKYNHV